jgi:ATP adenylyltransferase
MPPHPSPLYERLRHTVARRILGEDVTQIDYTTERVKRMVGRVLTGNGISLYGDGLYNLIGAHELSDIERDALLQLCRCSSAASGWKGSASNGVRRWLVCISEACGFGHRSRHRSPISGPVKVRIAIRHQGSASTTWPNC